jgi:hypothetical protein
MRKNLLFSLFSFAAISAFAQDSTLLKNYKYRTPGFRALTVNFGMNGVFNDGKFNAADATNHLVSLQPSSARFSRFKSTDRTWQQIGIGAASTFSASGSKVENSFATTDRRSRSGSGMADAFITQRNYRQNNWYWEMGASAFAGAAGNRTKDSALINKNRNPQLGGTVTLGFGRGRLELVQDAQMALFILNDLRQQGLLQQEADQQTALELAQVITGINNRRVFDSRRRRIYELTTIHEFLQQKGLTGTGDIRVFTTINDNWALAFNPLRYSGTNWYFNVTPSASWVSNTNTNSLGNVKTESKGSAFGYGLQPTIGFNRYVPKSLHWQRNMGVMASYSRNNLKEKAKISNSLPELEEITETSMYHTYLFYEMGYYPNNRTLVNAGVNMTGTWNQYDGTGTTESMTTIKPGAYLTADYFISYNTRLSLQAGASYEHNKIKRTGTGVDNTNRNLLGTFSIGIAHVIF